MLSRADRYPGESVPADDDHDRERLKNLWLTHDEAIEVEKLLGELTPAWGMNVRIQWISDFQRRPKLWCPSAQGDGAPW